MPVNFPIDQIQSMINRLEDKLDQRLDKVDERLEKMNDKIDDVSKTTDRNTVVLEEHQRRALANEESTRLLAEQVRLQREELAAALKASEEKQDAKIKELSDSTELFTKFPKLAKKAGKIAASITGVATFLWTLFRLLSRHMGQ